MLCAGSVSEPPRLADFASPLTVLWLFRGLHTTLNPVSLGGWLTLSWVNRADGTALRLNTCFTKR